MTNTIIISDVHLGSEISRVKQLTPILENKFKDGNIKRLILLGDIFQDINFKRLTKYHWNFLSLIRKYSDIVEIVWVIGNHDSKISDVMSHLVGIETYEKYIWQENNKTYCAIHGHQFDKTINRFYKIKEFFIEIYLQLQKIKILNSLLLKCAYLTENGSIKLMESVKKNAIKMAKENRFDYIFCGHTHVTEHHIEDNIHYYNSGGWINSIGTIIIVDENGVNRYNFNTK